MERGVNRRRTQSPKARKHPDRDDDDGADQSNRRPVAP
ncbi:hypothetical protein ATSB10_14960 [Dyella thiooxydans]|uniref:Uncharacterized protein n=1 Tax=Dyella thiooxydans TaxID=445710 RepID=A0A160N018_9GAMM|nr:hypothetical protein ATSB10_14960 [Dyella thiooxydans]